MDIDLGVRFLFSPYATAFAAGALFAFCVALLKQRYKPKRRRDSAPESSVRNPEPEFPDSSQSPGLTKYNSVGSLCSNSTSNKLEELIIPRSVPPAISNFPAFDGGRSVPGIGGLPCIAKLRSFTFSDDLINLERRFTRFYDDLGTHASKSHSYSLPNFQRSRPWVFGSVYHQFQPFAPRNHSQFRNFCNWKPFQKNRRTVSLECPKLPVVYDPGSVLTKAAKALLENDFREIDSCVLRKRKSLPCFLKDLNSKEPKKDLKCADVLRHFVDFPPTNAELCKYLGSNRENNIPDIYSNNSKVTHKSFELSGINRNNIEYSISTRDNNTLENPLIDPGGIEKTKIFSDSRTNVNQTLDSSYYREDTVLESYSKIINCSKKLGEYYEKEISTIERDINFLKFKHENININTKNISPKSHTKNKIKFESSYFKGVDNETQIVEEKFLKLGNLYQDNEINDGNQISTESDIINNSIVDNSRSNVEFNHSECTSIEYSAEGSNENLNSSEKVDRNSQVLNEFSSTENSSTLEMSSYSEKNDEPSKKEPPPALRNCQNTGASRDDTAGKIEAEKSINSGNNFPKENLGKVQKPDKVPTTTRKKNEFTLSLTLGPATHFGGEEQKKKAGRRRVTNDRDVTRGGGGSRGEESRTRADDLGKRQMDRGTRERSVDGWEVSCAPARVFESSVSSETRNGVTTTTTVVSSVSSSDLDPWSEVLDATFNHNGTDMSVRTVISTEHSPEQTYLSGKRSPGQFRIDIASMEQQIVSPVSPTRSSRAFQKLPLDLQEKVVSPDATTRTIKKLPLDLQEKVVSPDATTRTIQKQSMDLQDKSEVSSVTPTRLNRAAQKQPLDSATSPAGKPAVPVKPSHLVRGERKPPTEEPYRPQFEEYMPEVRADSEKKKEFGEFAGRPLVLEESSPPRVSRLLGLLSRDEERRAAKASGASIEEKEEWDAILRGVLASVSELERWGGEESDVKKEEGKEDQEEAESRQSESSSSRAMDDEEVILSPPPVSSSSKEETPTKVKSLRFKLDPDIFDVPSDDSFYDDDEEDNSRGWRTRHRAYHTLEVGGDEPVRLVSVHASVVPAGQKMVARPVGIDLRVRLTEERAQSKRAHVGTSPLQQAKRRSPVSDSRSGWCQELSPVTENVDWRETFTSVPKENGSAEVKPVPNGILKTPSPKAEVVPKDSSNPFKEDLTNGDATVHVEKHSKPNGMTLWNPTQKKFSLPRKKFEPDPEAVDRITGYKIALSKPPLPPPIFQKMTTPPSTRNRAEMARKQYLDSKAALSGSQKADGSRKFQQFLAQAQSDRARIVTSVPDLVAIERAVSEKWSKERGSPSPRASPAREDGQRLPETPSSRGSTPDDAWSSYVQTCRKHLGRRSQSMTYLETDVDLHLPTVEDEDKWRSTTALDQPDSTVVHIPVEDSDFEQSREDLNDSGRAKSEHELRIQRSLQSLPLPDWYKRSDKPKTGFLLKSSEKEKRGWAAAKSLASSTSSLASCGVKRPVHSLRSSRENIPWSRSSPSPDGPALSLALARAFREPYLGWRARTSTTSSGVSSSPNSSWCAATTDEEANGISFDGEDAFLGRTSSEDDGGRRDEPPSPDDTGADAVTVSMDTGDLIKLPGGEDTCDDINNMSMDTCEMFDAGIVPDDTSLVPDEPSLVHEDLPSLIVGESSPQADTGDDIDNLSTDTTTDSKRRDKDSKRTDTDSKRTDTDSKRKDPKSKRYSYSRSIYHSEWDDDEESRGDRKGRGSDERDPSPTSPDPKVIWIESSFVGSRTTTSIVVLPEGRESKVEGDCIERPASR